MAQDFLFSFENSNARYGYRALDSLFHAKFCVNIEFDTAGYYLTSPFSLTKHCFLLTNCIHKIALLFGILYMYNYGILFSSGTHFLFHFLRDHDKHKMTKMNDTRTPLYNVFAHTVTSTSIFFFYFFPLEMIG